MSLLNVNIGLLAYVDGPSSTQPKLRQADLQWSMMGIPTNNLKQIPLSLSPGETQTIQSLAKPLSLSSDLIIEDKGQGVMRITASLGQRTARPAGDQTTVFEIKRTGQAVKQTYLSGPSPDFLSIQTGDRIKLDAGFSALNQGEFVILSKGVDFVEYQNPVAQDETTSGTLSIYSSGPVQKGDILDLSNEALALPNQGAFSVLSATDTYIEVLNPQVFPQTVLNVLNGVTVYPFSYKWMALVVDKKALVGLNGEEAKIEVEPPVENDLIKNPGIFLKRGKVFEVSVKNTSSQRLEGFLILAE